MEGAMDFSIEMSVPLDDDGFLRRACPACGREFKWLHTETDDDADSASDAPDYFCPYCGVNAASDQWWTGAQLAAIEAVVMDEVIEPEVDGLRRQANSISKESGGLLSLDIEVDRESVPALQEPNDMTKIDFACHPGEPVKIVESWVGSVHCLTCGVVQGR
jgi:hypothetical protein